MMGVQEKEIAKVFSEVARAMQKERDTHSCSETIVILTAALVLKRALEKCTFEIVGSLDAISVRL